MKLPPILTGIVLDPAAGTLDFSALGVGFDPRTVLAVLHEPTNRFLFAKGALGPHLCRDRRTGDDADRRHDRPRHRTGDGLSG